MNIPGVTGASRTAGNSPETPASMPPVRQGSVGQEVAAGSASQEAPPPLRFPWLSRLSQELAPSAPQKPAFPPAPVLGDNLDRSV